MPLSANVLRRRPAADASPLISRTRAFAPTLLPVLCPQADGEGWAFVSVCGPMRPVGLRDKIKEEAFAAGKCRGTFVPEAYGSLWAARQRNDRRTRRGSAERRGVTRIDDGLLQHIGQLDVAGDDLMATIGRAGVQRPVLGTAEVADSAARFAHQ